MIIRDLDNEVAIINNGRMDNKFSSACNNGDLELVKNLYLNYSKTIIKNKLRHAFYRLGGVDPTNLAILNPHAYSNAPIKNAFASNHYDIVEFLLTDNNFLKGLYKEYSCFKLSGGLSDAIRLGNFKMIDLVIPLIKETPKDIYDHIHHGFRSACVNGQTDIIDYVLTNNQIKEMLDPTPKDSFGIPGIDYFEHLKKHGFISACHTGNWKTVEYFTKSNNPQIRIDFNTISTSTQLIVGSFELLEYFIFDLNVDKYIYNIGNLEPSEKIGDFTEINQKIEKMFEKRELFKSINEEFIEAPSELKKTTKMKI